MTYDDFLAKLRETPREGWAVDIEDCIRFKCDACPITALQWRDASEWQACAADLGIDPDSANTIMASADETVGCDYRMRRDLLEACGLLEPAQPAPQAGVT